MEYNDKIEELINEAEKHTFETNCYSVGTTVFAKAGSEMRAWIAECENFIESNYGKDSSPWKIFKEFNIRIFTTVHGEVKFNKHKDIIISALTACKRIPPNKSKQTPENVNETDVFIIHGHDDAMKKAVQLFLSRACLKDIVLHEQPDKNRTVIEKLIEEGNNAAYVIALLSPDDIQDDGTVRARQNVVLEIGYFIGKLGREKVKLLRKGDVVIPSDLQGILFENYDNEGVWRIKLLKEMKAVGLPIDLENVMQKF